MHELLFSIMRTANGFANCAYWKFKYTELQLHASKMALERTDANPTS